MRNDLDAAKSVLVEGLQVAQEIEDQLAQSHLIYGLACHAAATGKPRLAAQLLGAAEAIQSETGGRPLAFLAGVVERAHQRAATSLGATTFEAEHEAGQSMTSDSVVRLVLGQSTRTVAAERAEPGPLAGREMEVARLVGQGLSNKQIAARLFIFPYTVDSHIRNTHRRWPETGIGWARMLATAGSPTSTGCVATRTTRGGVQRTGVRPVSGFCQLA